MSSFFFLFPISFANKMSPTKPSSQNSLSSSSAFSSNDRPITMLQSNPIFSSVESSSSKSTMPNFPPITSTSTSITCSDPTIPTTWGITCTGAVTGDYPTGTIAFSNSGSGDLTFSPSTCDLYLSSCTVNATGEESGSDTVVGSYSGDQNNEPSSGTTQVTVTLDSSGTDVLCSSSVEIGGVGSCSGVVGSLPGTITFSSSGGISFSPSSCVNNVTTYYCAVTEIGDSLRTYTVTATYSGSSLYSSSSSSTTVSVVNSSQSSIFLSCWPATAGVDLTSSCTVEAASGNITLSASPSGIVPLEPSTCSVSPCTVTVQGLAAGSVTITASGSGGSASTPITIPLSGTVVDQLMSVAREPAPIGTPVTPTSSFTIDDSRIYAWVAFSALFATNNTILQNWYAPNGTLFDSTSLEVQDFYTEAYFASHITVSSYLSLFEEYSGQQFQVETFLNGALVSTQSFTIEPPSTLTFIETGLPSGTQWGVSVDGSLESSTTVNIQFEEGIGLHTFEVSSSPSGYTITPANGMRAFVALNYHCNLPL